RARWRHEGRALEVRIDEARFANADTEARFSGLWRSLPDAKVKGPGYVELRGEFTRGDITKAGNYIPNRLTQTRDWLDNSLQAGSLARAGFEVKGDLYEFPFGHESTGHFLFEGDVRGAKLRFNPSWPSIDAIDGTFRFENRRMEILASKATIF